MDTRKKLLPIAAFAGLMMSGAAHAAPVFQPEGGWTVSKISAPAKAGSAAYCTLARRYSNAAVLTFIRDSHDESSLTIDFQKDGVFDKAATYYVVVRPGEGRERTFEAHPVSGRSMVVRPGNDYAFYDAMSRAAQIDVNIAADTYSFRMNDFQDGQQQLSGCLANLTEPSGDENKVAAAKQAPAKTPVPQAVAAMPVLPVSSQALIKAPASNATAPAADALQEADTVPAPASDDAQGGSDATRKIEALHEENVRLREALESERRAFEGRTLHDDKNSSLTSELNQKIDLLQRQNAELLAQTAGKPQPQPPQAGTDAHLSDAMKSLQAENGLLKQEVAQLQAGNAKTAKEAELDRKLAEANKVSEEASAKMAEAARKESFGNDQRAEVAKKLAEAAAKIDDANRKMADADQKLAQLNQKELQANQAMAAAQQQQALADQKLSDAATKLRMADQKKAESDEQQADAVRRAAQQAEHARTSAIMKPSVYTPAPVMAAVAPVSAQPAGTLLTAAQLENFLGPYVVLKDGIRRSEAARGSVAYSWQSGSLLGSAEQQPLKDIKGFNGEVSKFLTKAQNLCTGSFAAKPGLRKESNGMVVSVYEIVCISDSSTLSASVLFYSQNGLFTTIAHKSSLEDMDTAMDIRDKLAGRLMQGNVAAN